jgi:hypothetical protein
MRLWGSHPIDHFECQTIESMAGKGMISFFLGSVLYPEVMPLPITYQFPQVFMPLLLMVHLTTF